MRSLACGLLFLSDPSPIIRNACHSLTHSLTDSLLFSKLDGYECYQLLDDVATATYYDVKSFVDYADYADYAEYVEYAEYAEYACQ